MCPAAATLIIWRIATVFGPSGRQPFGRSRQEHLDFPMPRSASSGHFLSTMVHCVSMDQPRGFRRRRPRTGQSWPARTIFIQYNIPGVGKRICQRRTSGSTDPGQGKARQVCLTRDLLRCRLDIVQCLPGANHLSTGERIILFICPAEQHNKGRRGKGKVANRYRGEADVARGKNVCFESILQFYLFG